MSILLSLFPILSSQLTDQNPSAQGSDLACGTTQETAGSAQSWTPANASPRLGTELSPAPSLLRFGMALTVGDGAGDEWRVTGALLGHSAGGCALLSAGCSAATVRRALGERFLPARSLPPEPCLVLNRASHVILVSACQPSPFSKHFVPYAFLQDVSYSSSLVGGAAPSLQEAVYQTPWGSLEESHEKWIFVAQKRVCPTKAWQWICLLDSARALSCKCICNVTPCSPVFFLQYTLFCCHRSLQSRKEAGVRAAGTTLV